MSATMAYSEPDDRPRRSAQRCRPAAGRSTAGPSALAHPRTSFHRDGMVELSHYLRRFRRLVSPPGRQSPPARPADRRSALRDELSEVLQAIDHLEHESAHVREQAEQRARRRREEAEEEAERIRSRAEVELDDIQAEEAADRRRDIENEIERARAAGDERAEQIRGRAGPRVEGLAERIVQRILVDDDGEAR